MDDVEHDETQVSMNFTNITSPSQLQEVTLDQDASLSYSIRSPNGTMRGRSVKEIEEQLAFLKKDNFNLKLRIYFLEERMGSNFNLDKENIVKKNIELMVDVESLRKELQEKHDLLCQAVKAIELEDEEHKRLLNEKDDYADKLKNQIDDLKLQIIDGGGQSEFGASSQKSYNTTSTSDFIHHEAEAKISALQEELQSEKENTMAVQLVLDQKDSKIKQLESEITAVRSKETKQCDEMFARYEELDDQLRTLTDASSALQIENHEIRKKLHQQQADAERERKRNDKLKQTGDEQVADLQAKLESALIELKKSQDLVVAISSQTSHPFGCNECNSLFLVSQSATSARSTEADANALQSIVSPSQSLKSDGLSPNRSAGVCTPEFVISDNLEVFVKRLKKVQDERDQFKQKTVQLKAEQMKACKIIKSMIETRNTSESEIKELKLRIRQLEEVGANGQIITQTRKTSTNGVESEEACGENKIVEQYQILTEELEEKNKLLAETLDEKTNQFQQIQTAYEDLLVEQTRQPAYHQKDKQITQLNTEIARLNQELNKKNFNLQGLVNNELWSRNREIEQLNRHKTSDESSANELERLRTELHSKEAQLNVLKWKISDLGIDLHDDGDTGCVDLRAELQKSEQLRAQTHEVCAVLNRRLEELCAFLDTLLQQKAVLGFLGIKENKRLRQIIDQSVDLSRSLSASMVLGLDQSLAQLTNLTSILNETDGDSLSVKPAPESRLVDHLRQQIVNLQAELKLRDAELARCAADEIEVIKSVTLRDGASESESWSEPDRNVSRERIGLADLAVGQNESSSDEMEPAVAKSGSAKKDLLNESRNTIVGLHRRVTDLDRQIGEREGEYLEALKQNRELQARVDELEVVIREADDRKAGYEHQVARMQQTSEQSEVKLRSLLEGMQRLEEEVAELRVVKGENEERLAEVSGELATITARLRAEYEQSYLEKMQGREEEALRQIHAAQDEAENEVRLVREAIRQLQADYQENYMRKADVQAAINEALNLATIVQVLEERIEVLNRELEEERARFEEKEERINALRNELDDATLQYSEAVLEKSKIANEKIGLESELSRAVIKECDTKKRLHETENDIISIKNTYQTELVSFQQQKTRLEIKISELEQSNAELHNRLIKLQTAGYARTESGQILSQSLPISAFYRRQVSDGVDETYNRQLVQNQADVERHEANSSPDLGIESDQGRFSSLETNLSRPLLQTLELTESMSKLLDVNQLEALSSCGSDLCCERIMTMANENTDLRKKLLRTRRALENTVTQLALANQRKKQVEKNICKQIHKTSCVLRKAKANLDSGSETDVYYKK